MSENNKAFFSKLTSHVDALQMVDNTAKAFFLISGLSLLSALFVSVYALIDVATYAAGAYFLRRYRSRAAAWVLLAYAAVMAFLVVAEFFGAAFVAEKGRASPFLAVVGLWAGTRAVEAVTKLQGSLSAPARNHVVQD